LEKRVNDRRIRFVGRAAGVDSERPDV